MKYVYRVFIIISILLLSTALCFGYMIKPTETNNSVTKRGTKASNEKEPKIFRINAFEGDEPLRILVIGIDKTATTKLDADKNPMRADTIMLLTLDPARKKVQLLSIPRDSRVKIKGHGMDKINHSYYYGEYELLKGTIEDFLDTKINHHVVVDYEAVSKLIDAIGGVDMYVPFTYKYEDPSVVPKLVIDFKEGDQHLDGETAVKFLRVRKIYENQDIDRIAAQQEFLMKVFDKMKNPALIFKLPTLLDIFQKYVKTDLSYGQIADLSYFMLGVDKDNIIRQTLDGYSKYIDKISYYIVDKEHGRQLLKDFFKEPEPDNTTENTDTTDTTANSKQNSEK